MWFSHSPEEVLTELNVRKEDGLSTMEATERLARYGSNHLKEKPKRGLIALFFDQLKDMLIYVLLGAAVITLVIGEYADAVIILLVVVLNAVIGVVQEYKSEKAIEALKKMSSPKALVRRDGEEKEIDSEQIVPGDIVIIDTGRYIPADVRLIETVNLQIEESALTGESVPAAKNALYIFANPKTPIGDKTNMAFMSTVSTYGRGEGVVVATGMETEIGKIAKILDEETDEKTPLQKRLDELGKVLGIVAIVICVLIFFVGLFQKRNLFDMFLTSISLAVAAIPEALSSIVTIVLSFGTQKMARENAIIRKLQAVEGLGSVSIICSDKTGTLTQNKMTVKKYCVNNQIVEGEDCDFSNPLDRKLLTMGILCNDATNVDGKEIGDPTEVAIINFTDTHGADDEINIRNLYPRAAEVPFDSDRKLMSTVHTLHGKTLMVTKGAVDVLFHRCVKIEKADGVFDLTEQDVRQLEKINAYFSENGLRVLAFAYKELEGEWEVDEHSENDLTFIGLVAMMDPPREESKQAVEECIAAGIRPVMITGDHKVTAAAIAKQIGILHDFSEAVDGAEIDKLSDEELQEFVEHVSVYARVSPEHKIRIVRAWQAKGCIVSMTGDGVNDAPALKQADVGVAMGITGSEVAKDAASMVLTDDNFATIVKAIENGRNVYANIKKAIKFLLSGNMAAILAVLFASLGNLPVPFAAVHLLFINLLTDGFPAIALGLEPHDKAVMKEKPRSVNESILTKDFILDVLIQGFIISVAVMGAFLIGNHAGGAGLASTMAFATLCLGRIFHGFSSKSARPVIGTKKMWNNKFLLLAIAADLILLNAALFIPGVQRIFSVTPMNGMQVLIVYGFSLASMLAIQLVKGIVAMVKKK